MMQRLKVKHNECNKRFNAIINKQLTYSYINNNRRELETERLKTLREAKSKYIADLNAKYPSWRIEKGQVAELISKEDLDLKLHSQIDKIKEYNILY